MKDVRVQAAQPADPCRVLLAADHDRRRRCGYRLADDAHGRWERVMTGLIAGGASAVLMILVIAIALGAPLSALLLILGGIAVSVGFTYILTLFAPVERA